MRMKLFDSPDRTEGIARSLEKAPVADAPGCRFPESLQ